MFDFQKISKKADRHLDIKQTGSNGFVADSTETLFEISIFTEEYVPH